MKLTQSHEYFIDESIECLAETQRILRSFNPADQSVDLVSQVFRVIHSIKGTSATLGLTDITALTHHFENTLDYVLTITTAPHGLNDVCVKALKQSIETISIHFDIFRLGGTPSQEQTNLAILKLDALCIALKEKNSIQTAHSSDALVKPESHKPEHLYQIELYHATQNNIDHVTESLSGIGTLTKATLNQSSACCFELLTTETPETIGLICAFYFSRRDIAITLLSDTQSKYQSSIEGKDLTSGTSIDSDTQLNHSVRVHVGQLIELKTLIDDLSNLKDEMSIDQDRLIIDKNLRTLNQNIQKINQLLSQMRNLSLEHLFSKIPTLTKSLSARLGKKVEIHITGAELVTDKFIIEQLNVPLIQLIRNSIDHGIEVPQVRRHLNKSEYGKIFLCAKYEKNQLILELSDDGVGLDRTKVLAAAINKNIPVPKINQDQDVWSLIFAPGLTTSQAVTDISGRGFGLDIVKQRIENLGGKIRVETVLGQQTKFIISIPVKSLSEKNQTEIYPETRF
jgi:two-component system chemotaxis sensor kinase CheA